MIKISGFSDDLIEIEGAIDDEISSWEQDTLIEFHDGTILRMTYDIHGVWCALVERQGTAQTWIEPLFDDWKSHYSDLFTIDVDKIKRIWHERALIPVPDFPKDGD